jgi:hypothetical protein
MPWHGGLTPKSISRPVRISAREGSLGTVAYLYSIHVQTAIRSQWTGDRGQEDECIVHLSPDT